MKQTNSLLHIGKGDKKQFCHIFQSYVVNIKSDQTLFKAMFIENISTSWLFYGSIEPIDT